MLRILLVDDERDALEALEWKLNNYIDNVEITTCDSPIKAIEIINKYGRERGENGQLEPG